jgi:hypothetical protein
MGVTRGNGQNGGHFYSNLTQPVKIDLQFTVASTNANGLGVTSVKSNGYVQNVFMHTTVAPGTNNGSTNPNPLAGYAVIQLENNYNVFLEEFSAFVSPVTGAASNNNVIGKPSQIVSLGTTTAAQWLAAGVPPGFTAAVGLAYIAKTNGAIGGTGTVKQVGFSGITSVEVVGDVSKTIANASVAVNGGAQFIVQFLAPTAAGNTAPIATAPADGQIVSMSVYMDASSVTIDGL